MSSTGKKAAPAVAAGEALLPDGPLEVVFLGLDDAADLARASATCTSFRRVITKPAFRRRFVRAHRPPPIVGILEYEEGRAALHPRALRPSPFHHVSTPAGGAVARAADFALSFLPDPDSWRIHDASGGRLLLSSCNAKDSMDRTELVVCDPLHRMYFRVPPIPPHLTPRKPRPGFGWKAFLVPAGDEDDDEEGHRKKNLNQNQKNAPPLQVVWMVQRSTTMTAFVFSSSTEEWRGIKFRGWKREAPLFIPYSYRHYAHGCFYWTSSSFDALVLDVGKMEFSTMRLPSVTNGMILVVEAGGTNNLGSLVLCDRDRDRHGRLDLYCKLEKNGSNEAADWHHIRTVPLPNNDLEYRVVGSADGYLLLQAYAYALQYSSEETPQARYFAVKLKTCEVEELPLSFNKRIQLAHLYTNFPLPFSMPSVCNAEVVDQGVTEEASTST